MATDTVRAMLERVQIRKAAFGSYPWHAVDPVSGWPIALPPERDETIELHGKRYNAFRDMVWPKCFQRKRDVVAALARYRALLEDKP